MIEFCTKRRMIISIIILGILTVLILILEERLTSESHWNQSPTPVPNDSHVANGSDDGFNKNEFAASKGDGCWVTEDFKIVVPCSPCTHFEINSGSIPACELTGLKETIHCTKSGTSFRSCIVVPQAVKTRFWIFESFMLLIAVVSFGFIKFRTSQIERATIKQIEKRLASGM